MVRGISPRILVSSISVPFRPVHTEIKIGAHPQPHAPPL